MEISLENVTFGYDAKPILENVTIRLPSRGIVMLIGPNGCGKSTLLKLMAGYIRPLSGRVSYDGNDTRGMTPWQIARRLTYIPQIIAGNDLRVDEIVDLGRNIREPHGSIYADGMPEASSRAIEIMGIGNLAHRRTSDISGGELQRVMLAMAIARGTGTMLLDEPTSMMDMRNRLSSLGELRKLSEDSPIFVVTHDVNLAYMFADYAISVADGIISVVDSPRDNLSSDAISRLYNCDAKIIRNGDTVTACFSI